jgi:iron complex transport system substrate-binding protein
MSALSGWRPTAAAPLLAIGITGDPVDKTIERFAALAESLGASMDTGANAAQRQRFEQSRDDLAAAIVERPGLTALFVSGYTASLYVANPAVAVDVAWYRELGLNVPDVEVGEGEFWETLSWEQANRHPADLILVDIRGQALTAEQMTKDFPTFANLPAVKAGQVGKWYFEAPYSYRSMANVLVDLAATVRAANPHLI